MHSPQLQQLILKANELFRKYGIKNLTMDEIARELAISKKTIYKFVENKDELVTLVMQDYLTTERTQMEAILLTSKNSVEEMLQMSAYFFDQMRDFNPVVLHDIYKYYPTAWNLYNAYRFDYALGRITTNLLNGVKEGLYRNDLNVGIMARMYIGGIDLLMNQEIFPTANYAFLTLYTEHVNYYMHGIVSDSGLKILGQHNFLKNNG